ncbi:MAG: DnaD domain protein [Oscillospiraceae bacterium]|jgi:DnaD/phage-associated family protein|nr:DnaD domain protein [Oscillospiraceae bacterium]
MDFSLDMGHWNSVFAVPTLIVDQYIKLANLAQIKVLLWTLRHTENNFSDEDIAKSLSMHNDDVKEAMRYWIKTKIISTKPKENSHLPKTNTPSFSFPQILNKSTLNFEPNKEKLKYPTPPIKLLKRSVRPISRPLKPDSKSIAKRIDEDSDISFLVQEAQIILGRPISNGDTATLLTIHDSDGLPVVVITMLLQYAKDIGKANMKYIEKVAINWGEEEINTLEKAENKIRALGARKKSWATLKKIIGGENRSPSTDEEEAANRWINEWKINEELIKEAYDRCVNTKGKYIVKYMDSIIKRWKTVGINSLEQAKAEYHTNNRKNSSKGYKSSYNIVEYENSSIFY